MCMYPLSSCRGRGQLHTTRKKVYVDERILRAVLATLLPLSCNVFECLLDARPCTIWEEARMTKALFLPPWNSHSS